MTTKIVKDTLATENKLLAEMIAVVKKFPTKDAPREAEEIRKSWERFLGDRKRTNAAQIRSSDAKLKQDFLAEICQIGAYVCVTPDPKQAKYTEMWRKFIECERDISAHLFRLVGRRDVRK